MFGILGVLAHANSRVRYITSRLDPDIEIDLKHTLDLARGDEVGGFGDRVEGWLAAELGDLRQVHVSGALKVLDRNLAPTLDFGPALRLIRVLLAHAEADDMAMAPPAGIKFGVKRLLDATVQVLPWRHRFRYRQESLLELYEEISSGASWWQQLTYLGRLLVHFCRLRVELGKRRMARS